VARVGTHLALARLRREATRREQAARAEAEAAVRARDEFLSIASHELRTPVTVVKGVAQMLQRLIEKGTLDPERLARQLQTINRASDRLTVLVSDLLDVSRLQSGQFILRPAPVDLVTLIREVLERRLDSVPAGYTLTADLPADAVPVEADTTRIEQILDNLLDNALKYSPQGGAVDVRLTCAERVARVSVADRGIGLPADALEQIFEPFGRATNAVVQNLPGLGLGLYVCRRIAELHGGRLTAHSDGENRGSRFDLELPLMAGGIGERAGQGEAEGILS
jgi:two-component system, OmpR family, sensor kinase